MKLLAPTLLALSLLAAAAFVALAKARGITTLVDGAQAVPHQPVDVDAIGADFYVFSGHKVFGPSGAGVLHGRHALLDAMPPFLGGGDMIEVVSFDVGDAVLDRLDHAIEKAIDEEIYTDEINS